MKIRGQRECVACGTRWSYYETGEVACPACESLRSRGVDDRTEHTASPVALDLSPARSMVDEEGLNEALSEATERCRSFITQTGFIHAGELQELSEAYLAATELRYSAREAQRSMRIDEETELYLLSLLGGADTGERPAPEEIPDAMRSARGLAYAGAIEKYRTDLRRYLDEHPDKQTGSVLTRIAEHTRRIEALDGDVAPEITERLVRATRELYEHVCTDADTLAVTQSRLDSIE